MIAALFVETGGSYFGLEDVDPWDETRDARLYAGPWPVVAHPPCAQWCMLAPIIQAMYGYQIGDDQGCFASAIASVREYGGVLEHPAYTRAWAAHDLPRPTRGMWVKSLLDPGWVTEVSQSAYGHPTRKRTWLYYVGDEPAELNWDEPPVDRMVSDFGPGNTRRRGDDWQPGIQYAEAAKTPAAFRDTLISLAQSASLVAA